VLERLNAVDKEILRIAIYEIDNLAENDAGAIVYDAVELAKRYGDLNSGDFINGILRNYLREKNGEVTT
jgi:N utilization substance protein B